jgi:hypothetical protein
MADSFKPPEAARTAAAHGLELRKNWERGGTPVGVARARDLSGGKGVSRETVGRMAAFARHLDQPESKPADGGPSARAIAIKLWGGRAGVEWAQGVMRKLARAKKAKAKKD